MTLDQYGLIAVVDDDVSMLNALRRLLVARRYQVQTFQSAEELLQSPELDQFACVVSDIDLRDGMSGLDLGERMRARGHGARLRRRHRPEAGRVDAMVAQRNEVARNAIQGW